MRCPRAADEIMGRAIGRGTHQTFRPGGSKNVQSAWQANNTRPLATDMDAEEAAAMLSLIGFLKKPLLNLMVDNRGLEDSIDCENNL